MTGLPASGPTQAAPFMYIFGGIILVGVLGWYSFSAFDRLGLEDQTGAATVVAKEHHDARRGYTTEIIGGTARAVPHAIPEMYILKLEIDGCQAAGIVEKSLYDAVAPRDQVRATYKKRRITGGLQIVRLTRWESR